jgi:hypothetical protein
MAALGVREGSAGDDASRLGRIVVRDGGLQMLAEWRRLPELSPEPAKEADRGLIRHGREASARPRGKTPLAIVIMAA